MWAAFGGKGANYPSQDSRISVFVAKKHSGARNFACGANYLAPGWFNSACQVKSSSYSPHKYKIAPL